MMIEVRVLGVALDAARQHIVLLKPLHEEMGLQRVLPIWIGAQEATSIVIAVAGEQPPRPLTHDLTMTLLDTLHAQVARVEVTRIDDGTFYAELTLTTPAGPRVIDARPSDAVALAVRADAPIFVDEAVLDEAGIPGEIAEPGTDDADDTDESGEAGMPDDAVAERTDEAAVDEFKRFLEGVDPEDFQG